MLLGAYGFAISVQSGLGFWPAVLIALVVVMVFALILGVPTLKLRGDYLAIVTIAAAEIVRDDRPLVDSAGPITGGSNGIPGAQYRDAFNDLSFFPPGSSTLRGSHSRTRAWPAGGSVSWPGPSSPPVPARLVADPAARGRVLKGIREGRGCRAQPR